MTTDIPALLPSQVEALERLRTLIRSPLRRPTFLLTGAPGTGKTAVAKALATSEDGWYWNFTLTSLEGFFGRHNPLHLRVPQLVGELLAGVATSPKGLVILDGLEACLTGLLPNRRRELAGFLAALASQTTGRQLVVVIASQPGSPFLAPADVTTAWNAPEKVVTLALTPGDSAELAARFGLPLNDLGEARDLFAVRALLQSHLKLHDEGSSSACPGSEI
jgi:SpoVK/Ycf46/Vps4 family AAA+-type ATPase